MLQEPSIPRSQPRQGALNGARTPAVPPHTVFLSRAARQLVGFPEHPTGMDPAGPCPAPGRQNPRASGSAGFSTSKMLRLTPGLHLSSLSISPGRRQEPGGTGATAPPSKQVPAQGCHLKLSS